MPHEITSVGIDVGTTTTHLTLSRLTLTNEAAANQAPRLVIADRHVFYQSPVYFTPLTADAAIDGCAVAALLAREYKAAGIAAQDVSSGAAIVTGETARLRNANKVIHALAAMAGDFVVASAGPHLESVLAGRGSGAAAESRKRRSTIMNVDIGGGTTNMAVFAGGKLLDTSCLAIGGRCLRLSRERQVLALSESGELFLNAVGKPAAAGDRMEEARLELIGDLVAEAIIQSLLPGRLPQIASRLLLTEPLRRDYSVDEIWLSGGVAELMKAKGGDSDPAACGDMGAYLARGLVRALGARRISYRVADNPIRATVIGAGHHSLQLSGSTIAADHDRLPVRNLPLVSPFSGLVEDGDFAAAILRALEDALNRHDLNWTVTPLAVALQHLARPDFQTLRRWADALTSAFRTLRGREPFVLVACQDIGMALGQLIRQQLPDTRVLVVDGVMPEGGDFIDIGRPVAGGDAVPVVVKSLVFRT